MAAREETVVVDQATIAILSPPAAAPLPVTDAIEEKRKKKKRSQESAERNRIMAKVNRDRKKKELYDLELKAARFELQIQELQAEVQYLRSYKVIQTSEVATLRAYIKSKMIDDSDAPAPEEYPVSPQKMTEEQLDEESKKRVKTELPEGGAVAVETVPRPGMQAAALPGIEDAAGEALSGVHAPAPTNIPTAIVETAPDAAALLPPVQALAAAKPVKRKTPADEREEMAADDGDASRRPKTRGGQQKTSDKRGKPDAEKGTEGLDAGQEPGRTTRSGKAAPKDNSSAEDVNVAKILSSLSGGGRKANGDESSEDSGPGERPKRKAL